MPSSAFSKELERLLAVRGLSWRKLSVLVGYTPGWLSKIKNGVPPSADLARRCDEVLEAGGQLVALASVRAVRPAQMPASTASFVGRRAELARIAQALVVSGEPGTLRAVTVEGPPGVGKTALALRAARDVATRFADGHLYVDLHGHSSGVPVEPGQALEEFLRALGVPAGEIPVGLAHRAALFRSVLSERHVLVVLDNAASFRQIEHLLPGASGCAVVVTSRNRLSGLSIRTDAARVVLGPLTSCESTDLLHTVIGTDRATAEATALADLARRCAYLPLALRIAADHVITHPDRSVSDLIEDLATDGHLEVLSADEATAVRKVFSWSYRTLDAPTARMFRLISLHPGPTISVPAAAALTGLTVGKARPLVDALVRAHLIEPIARDRYRVHDLLRFYGSERAQHEDADRAEAIRRLTDWYLHTAAAANESMTPFRVHVLKLEEPSVQLSVQPQSFQDSMAAMRWCDTELLNFVPISRLAAAHSLPATVWRLPIALFDYLLLRKPWGVWVTTHELGHSAAVSLGDSHAAAWVQTNLAVACRWLRDFERSERLYAEAMAVRVDIGDLHGQAWVLEGLAALAMDRGQVEQARDHAERGLEIFAALGDREGQAAALVALSEVHLSSADLDPALTAAEEALRMCEDMADLYGQGRKLVKVADVHAALGHPTEALSYVDRSLAVRRRAGDQWGQADSLTRQGDILRDLDRVPEARDSWRTALELYQDLADPRAADLRTRLLAHDQSAP
ncbi:ATP-binding protein [Actinocrispum wychmicini]|uniref:Tetratricopeptide repeat protein n=1 Tax=Actinocrispum wychmicini TaxID=1213861 RepID=A0A4R2J8N1_9PSEU|nr:tetratricopeptide repeat protein [Actinocrispum wychmicini]TCO52898.1 tetratricopeptide repeat protein [Actinocrispum wychmicini]